MEPIIIVEGYELQQLIADLNYKPQLGSPAYKLSVHVDGKQVKFKVNERMWSPPIGKKRED